MDASDAESSLFLDGALPSVLIDLEGRVAALNRACQEMFGAAAARALSPQVFAEQDRDEIRDLLADVLAGRRSRATFDSRLTIADGSVIAARLWASPVRGADGVVSHVLGSVVDITDQVDALERLERTSAAHVQFAADVSHEIRTPLHAVLGLAELLAAADLGERDAKLASAIVAEAAALKAVIDDTLDMSRIDSGTIELHEGVFSPAECAAGAIRMLRPEATEKGLELTVRVDPLVPPIVRGDEHRVRQILVNLLNNAVKFTEAGLVSLVVSAEPGDHLRFTIADTGPGIPESGQSAVFDPFFRLHADSADGGAGLGLAITSRLISALDGEITLESTVGVGTSFMVSVPLPRAHVAEPAEPGTRGAQPGEGRCVVLVVDDSEVNQLLVVSQLERLGYGHLVAASAPEAFAMIAEHGSAIDVILMDWHLPGLDGLDATRAIRAREAQDGARRIPVVAVTARAMAGDRQLCLDAGMDDYLAKPVGLDRLRACLAAWTSSPAEPLQDSAPVAAGDAAVDRGVIGALVDELGDTAVVARLVETFLAELPGRLDSILRQADPRAAAHTLKSTAQMLGATAVAERCLQIEQGIGEPLDEPLRSDLVALAERSAAELVSAIERLSERP